ncbi:unnamed protein product [Prunus armeniaca]|uniref:Uncharacterized protein n=1 Tax=Prunus armeniaca TaxID=36596 RepID=A0A6J5UNL2_PRUAR|nr:unnamed protein product [Prunus armeniaca]
MDLKTLNLLSFRRMVELMMNLASLSSLALVQYAMSLMVYPPWMLGIGQNDGKCDVDEHIMDVNFSGKTSLTSESRSSWLSKRFDEELRDNTKMKVTDFMKTVRKHYAIDVTEAQVYKAKSFAKIRIQVSIEEKYGKLKTQRLGVVSLTYSFKMLVFKMAMATMATTLPVFEAEIVQMLGQSKAAYKWLEERPAAH